VETQPRHLRQVANKITHVRREDRDSIACTNEKKNVLEKAQREARTSTPVKRRMKTQY
jgi:hypothetical protein